MEEFLFEQKEEKSGQIIVIASAKGGVGKTVISVNLAVALAQKGSSTCIIDGDFQFGDVNLALDLQSKLTISDLVQDIKALNSEMLENYLQAHECGVKVLAAPLRPEYADLIASPAIAEITNKLSEMNQYVVVDMGAGLTETNVAFMELATKIIVITDLEMAALKNTKAMIKTLEVLGLGEKTSLLVNRCNMESIIKLKDVSKILDAPEMYSVSNDFKTVSKSFNIGIPFVISKPDERISREVETIANRLLNRRASARNKRRKKKSFMDFLKFKKS